MRLQISVQRHSLPVTNILFTTRSLGPSPATSSTSATVSQLLEDINDIVPLESPDWGLEDYAVEVNGYECLHYQPIDSVLREDDRLVIRALRTEDLRLRRLGGRHQISSDGRHLIDGVAFGKPWLRKGGRPAVQIPPRKRRRLDLDFGDGSSEHDTQPDLLRLTGVDDIEGHIEHRSDEEADADFVVESEAPLQILARQSYEDTDEESQVGILQEDSDADSDYEYVPVEDMELSAELKALLEDDISESENDRADASAIVHEVMQAESSPITIRPGKRKRISEDDDLISTDFNGVSSPFETEGVGERHISDSDTDPDLTSSSGSSSDRETNNLIRATKSKGFVSFDGYADSDESSSDSSDTSSESDSESVSTSDSLSSSSSSSDSSVEEDSFLKGKAGRKLKSSRTGHQFDSTTLASHVAPPLTSVQNVTIPPGQGLKRTQSNNRRAKKRKRLSELKEQGLLPENANFTDMAAFLGSEGVADDSHVSSLIEDRTMGFEEKKQEILAQLEAQAEVFEDMTSDNKIQTRQDKPLVEDSSPAATAMVRTTQMETPKITTPIGGIRSEPANKRPKLDLRSSRNMIFGSLGVRNPKTAAAEQALREKFDKQIQGTLPKQLFGPSTDKPEEASPNSVDLNNDWQDKIVLSAVECEMEGVKLKPPPFPFVQGWDEEANWRHSKSKKRGRNQRHYYDDGDVVIQGAAQDDSDLQDHSMLESVRQNASLQDELVQEAESALDYAPASPDLPRPEDFDSCCTFHFRDAQAGVVIAFKEIHLSEETKWSPQISDYQVARVTKVQEDGSLELSFSKRDRAKMKPVEYDEENGKRIFGKFEVPDAEDDLAEDNGNRTMSYDEFIEPKIVQFNTSNIPYPKLKITLGQQHYAKGSAVIQESNVVPNPPISDAQPAVETVEEVEVIVATPRRVEISNLIKDAGFDSALDSELLQPTDGIIDGLEQSSPGAEFGANSNDDPSQEAPAATTNESYSFVPETSGFDSPRFNGWSSSPLGNSSERKSDRNINGQSQMPSAHDVVGADEACTSRNVTYPRLSQLGLDDSTFYGPDLHRLSQARRTNSKNAGTSSDEGSNLSLHDDDGNEDDVEAAHETNPGSLKSVIPPSVGEADELTDRSHDGSHTRNPFLGGPAGHVSSDDDDLPSLTEITSSARSPGVSPPPLRKARKGAAAKPTSDSHSISTNGFSSQQVTKQSQSQVRLSQIPAGSQIVDLTISSDPFSPGKSDEDYSKAKRLPRKPARAEQNGSGESKALAASVGLGNRKLLKRKKAKF